MLLCPQDLFLGSVHRMNGILGINQYFTVKQVVDLFDIGIIICISNDMADCRKTKE